MFNLKSLVKSESFGGILLFSAAMLALILDNSPANRLYESLLSTNVSLHVGDFSLAKPLVLWVNDGLMAIFFLLVGLEIKREICKGVLNDIQVVILPAVGALGGLLLPGLIYVLFNYNDKVALHGWAIPVATDIAFSLGILSLLGRCIPTSLKIFLTALAIIDDIGAIIIIAFFYTLALSYTSLFFAALMILLLVVLNKSGVKRLGPYILIGLLLWVSVLKSGVHATLAGIVLAFAIPLDAENDKQHSPLVMLEHALVPWVTYLVLPVFAFANAGFSFKGLSLNSLFNGIPFGIMMGLFVGKQIGIFTSCWLLVKSKFAKLPEGMNWSNLYGVALLCGVGFTMSLFIGGLAFSAQKAEYARYVRLGVLIGSLLSGLAGYFYLKRHCK